MKNFRIIRHQLKEPVIYKSEHEPFLSGNIARGVIKVISRKAISPLISSFKTNSFFLSFISRKFLYPDNSKKFSNTPFVYGCWSFCPSVFQLAKRDRQQHRLYLRYIHRHIKNKQTENTLLFLSY